LKLVYRGGEYQSYSHTVKRFVITTSATTPVKNGAYRALRLWAFCKLDAVSATTPVKNGAYRALRLWAFCKLDAVSATTPVKRLKRAKKNVFIYIYFSFTPRNAYLRVFSLCILT
jgi:hypothetical protein